MQELLATLKTTVFQRINFILIYSCTRNAMIIHVSYIHNDLHKWLVLVFNFHVSFKLVCSHTRQFSANPITAGLTKD